MSLFDVNLNEVLTFFAVLVRYSVLLAVLPFTGDRLILGPVKILASLIISVCLFPSLVAAGYIHPREAGVWGTSVSGILTTVTMEVLFGLVIGYTAKLGFDSINVGANLVGNFMGYSAASYYDPHQETQTEVIAQLQNAIAMLLFLALDGHHLILRVSLDSYRFVGLGRTTFNSILNQQIIYSTAQIIKYGLQISAPVAISLFSVNVIFGIMSKAIPQLNIFALSFALTALIGFLALLLSLPAFESTTVDIISKSKEWMESCMLAMAGRR